MNAHRGLILAVTALAALSSSAQGTEPRIETSFVSPGNADWRPAVAEQATVERLTDQYFKAKDAGNYPDAYLLFSPTAIEWERWRALSVQFNGVAGAVKSRRIKKITWYQDPPSGGPGVFAAVDFEGQFENLAFQCGYLAWRQQPNGSFLVVREEQNYIELAQAAKLTPDELKLARKKFRC